MNEKGEWGLFHAKGKVYLLNTSIFFVLKIIGEEDCYNIKLSKWDEDGTLTYLEIEDGRGNILPLSCDGNNLKHALNSPIPDEFKNLVF